MKEHSYQKLHVAILFICFHHRNLLIKLGLTLEEAADEIGYKVLQMEFKLYFIMGTFGLLSPRHLEKVQYFFSYLGKVF